MLLGVVSRRYQPLQNVEAFTFFDSIVQEGKAYFETAGSLGESYLGQRVYDLLRTIDFLEDGGATVSLIGRGIGSVPTVLAALLHRSQPACEIVDYLPSYEFLIDRPVHNWPLSCFIENCLAAFDLPDIYAALGNKLQEREPWGAMP